MFEKISSVLKRNKIIRFRSSSDELKIKPFWGLWWVTYNLLVFADTISDLVQAYYLYKGNSKNKTMIFW